MNEKMFNSEVRRTLHTETQDGFFLFGAWVIIHTLMMTTSAFATFE